MPKEMLHIDDTLKRIDFSFRLTGINIKSSKRTAAQNNMYKIRYFFNFVWINMDVTASIAWCIKGIKDGISFTAVTQGPPGAMFCLLGDVKSASFLIYNNSVNQLMAALKDLENKENDRKRPDELNEIIKKEIGFLHRVLKVYSFVIRLCSANFALLPLVAVAIHYFRYHEVKLFLPFYVLLPFDPYDIRFWPFVYLHQMWSVLVVPVQTSAGDLLFFTCSTYLRIQFITLGYDFEKILDTSDSINRVYSTDELKNRYIALVKRHRDVLDAVAILEKIYTVTNLINFVASSMAICLSAFNFTKMEEKNDIITFLTLFAVLVLQIFFLCYYGDQLMSQSMQISDAVYNSNWYSAEKSIVMDSQIIIQRAQKPCKLTAYGFTDVNLLAFAKILNTAWSYFALLNTVYSTRQNN